MLTKYKFLLTTHRLLFKFGAQHPHINFYKLQLKEEMELELEQEEATRREEAAMTLGAIQGEVSPSFEYKMSDNLATSQLEDDENSFEEIYE